MKKFLYSLMVLLAFAFPYLAMASAVEFFFTSLYVSNPPVSYWRMEGNSNDTQGLNNGTDTNMSYGSTGGQFGQYAIFSGTGYITTNTTSLPYGTSDRTVNLWAYLQNGAEQVLLNYGVNSGQGYFDWEVVDVGAGFRQFFNSGADQSLRGATTITLNAWHMFTFTKCGATSTLYQDGVAQNSVTVAYNTSPLTNKLTIGANETHNTNITGNGRLDDGYFIPECLSSSTIFQLFSGTLPPLPATKKGGIIKFL